MTVVNPGQSAIENRKSEIAHERVVMHVDMDAFFASVEQQTFPFLRGKPIGVCGDPDGRTVIAAASYEAKRRGVKTAMTIPEAKKLCPEIILVGGHPAKYVDTSTRILAFYTTFTDLVEVFSIDEAFLDVTQTAHLFHGPEEIARRIKAYLKAQFGLTCSVGIAPNKLVAKIASDYHKPDGLTIVEEKDVKAFLAPLPVEKLWGVGRKTKVRLNAMGICTIGDLASYHNAKLRDEFGLFGVEFHRMAHGIDNSEVVEEWTPKSFSREHTFEEDTGDQNLIYTTADRLFEEVERDVERNGFTFQTLTVKIRYEDFETHTRSRTLQSPAAKPNALKEVLHELVSPFLESGRKVRLVGVSASSLSMKAGQKTLI